MSLFSILKRFFSPMKENPLLFCRAAFQGFLWAFEGIIHLYFIQMLIVRVSEKNITLLYQTVFWYFIYIVVHEIVEYNIRNWGWVEAPPRGRGILGTLYIKRFISLDNTKTESIGTGKLVSIIGKGIDTWSDWLFSIFERGFAFLIVFLYVLFQLVKNDSTYALIFILLFILLFYFSVLVNNKTLIQRNKKNEYKSLFTKQLVKIIMSKFEILQSNKILKETAVLRELAENTYQANIQQSRYIHPYFRIPDFILSLSKIAICFFMGSKVINGTLPFSGFIGIMTALILMSKTLEDFLKLYKDFTKDFPDIEAFWNLFDTTPQIAGYETDREFIHSSGKIEIQNLDFGYHTGNFIFKDFSVHIKGEKITAFVGPSGGGKSTLAKLISGYISANNGQIIVDNQSLKDISLKSYYKDIGYLTQEPSVFDGSVLENLTYAIDSKLSKTKIKEAIELAHCEFIYELPHGLDTEIGERGVKLSGGQKQRLAIAKIILKNPKIIILDEPTSALDSFSEEKITQALNNLFTGRTVIVIAHRLQTVKHADEIIVIESGEIIERGTHNSLIKKGGYYKKMLDLQSGF